MIVLFTLEVGVWPLQVLLFVCYFVVVCCWLFMDCFVGCFGVTYLVVLVFSFVLLVVVRLFWAFWIVGLLFGVIC